MLTESTINAALAGLALGHPLHWFESIGSTNDAAKKLAAAGAATGTLVAADLQTAGRGRAANQWQTPPGSALAATVILHPALPAAQTAQLALLGGLAAQRAITAVTKLDALLKWPNDVLIGDRKVCGVLADSSFAGDRCEWVVLGFGINVNAAPQLSTAAALATALAVEAGAPVNRLRLLHALLAQLATLLPMLGTAQLSAACNAALAWRGVRVEVDGAAPAAGVLQGLNADGALQLRTDDGQTLTLHTGSLRRTAASLPKPIPARAQCESTC